MITECLQLWQFGAWPDLAGGLVVEQVDGTGDRGAHGDDQVLGLCGVLEEAGEVGEGGEDEDGGDPGHGDAPGDGQVRPGGEL